jgi:hypothetical protein
MRCIDGDVSAVSSLSALDRPSVGPSVIDELVSAEDAASLAASEGVFTTPAAAAVWMRPRRARVQPAHVHRDSQDGQCQVDWSRPDGSMW